MKLLINDEKELDRIEPEIYGHFSEHLGRCIYEGLFVGEDSEIPNVNGMRKDVVEALKEIQVPVLRWPGGCFADEYHWKDGIGDKAARKKMINTHWGGVLEDNSFGTHEYMELCKQIGCKTYVNGNMGSGTVQEMSEWVEYMTFNGVSPMANLRKANGHEDAWTVDYFGVGNENWGCGGNMTPEFYGNMYRRYQTFVRIYDENNPIKKVCCGANVDDYHWTEEVMKTCYDHVPSQEHGFMDLLSLHHYVYPEGWDTKGSSTEYDDEAWFKTMNKTLYMEELIRRHSSIMDTYDPDKVVGLSVDEWGAWYSVEPGTNPGFLYQQSTVRDALVAGITLNIFNKHCDRVKLACLAQTANVLQSVVLTEGPRMVKTPTYHVFHMYRHHQGANLLESTLIGNSEIGIGEWKVPVVTESVSKKDGVITITLNNLSTDDSISLDVVLTGNKIYELVEANIVSSDKMQDYNTFDNPDVVIEKPFNEININKNVCKLDLPPYSVVEIRIK